MQRPVMNPNFQYEQPPKPRDWKIVFRIARKAMHYVTRVLLFDVRPRFRKPRIVMEEGSPWARCLRGVFYRLACVPVLVAITAAILVFAITHPHVATSDKDPISAGVYYDPVTFLSEDETRIDGWIVPVLDANRVINEKERALKKQHPAIVLAHDFGQSRQQMLPLVRPLHDSGYVVLVIALRGSGTSSGTAQTFGLNEAMDIRAAVELLRRRNFVDQDRIAVIGVGAGANAALLAAERDAHLKVMIVEDPISYFDDALSSHIASGDPWSKWLRPLCRWTFEMAYQHNSSDIEPARFSTLFATRSILMLDNDPHSKRFSREEGIAQIQAFLSHHLSTKLASAH